MAVFYGHPVIFLKSVAHVKDLPHSGDQEIAFLGRSNVGKSSLINRLVNNKKLCKTSSTPGRTQMLNFFSIQHTGLIVDMPGYGYAHAPTSVIKKWHALILHYLSTCKTLKRLFLLVDVRHGLKEADQSYMAFLDNVAVTYQIVLTKSDKVTQSHRQNMIEDIKAHICSHGAAFPEVLLTSTHTGEGIKVLKTQMKKLLSI